MPRPLSPAVDPAFSAIAKAIYGDDIDPREVLAKSGGAAAPSGNPERDKKLAQVGLATTGFATGAGTHSITASINEAKHRSAAARGETYTPKPPGPRRAKLRAVGTKAARKVGLTPKRAAAAAGAGFLGMHGVELVADGLGLHAQNKALKNANAQIAAKKKPVSKGLRLRPLNVIPDRTPSLRAKRPKLSPVVGSPRTKAGVFQPVRKASIPAPRRPPLSAADIQKLKKLIPLPPRQPRLPPPRDGGVSKAEFDDVTWTGVIAKVDADKRQVFGWASVSRINGEDVVDLQGDVVPIEEIEKSAYKYVIESRKGGDMHRRVKKFDDGTVPHHTADMIESFVVTPEKLEKMGLPSDALPHGWWVGYHVNDDEQWALVKSGKRAGFSIHGSGTRTPVAKGLLPKPPKPPALKALGRAHSELETGSRRYQSGDHAVDMDGLRGARKKAIHAADNAGHSVEEMYHATRGAAAGRPRTPFLPSRQTDLELELGPKRLQRPGIRDWKGPMRPPRQRGGGVAKRGDARDPLGIYVTPKKKAIHAGAGGAVVGGAGGLVVAGRRGAAVGALGGAAVGAGHSLKTYPEKYRKRVALLPRDKHYQEAVRESRLSKRADGPSLRERTRQAVHPPPVRVEDVKSTAVQAMGYQRQTRRLSVVMRSRPDQPYEYRVKPGAAKDALEAPSKGHHYATEVRGRAKRAQRYTGADRARLFLNPDVSKSLRPIGKVPTR
jgi:hypothetical protein